MINNLINKLNLYENIKYGTGNPETIRYTPYYKKDENSDYISYLILLNMKYEIAIVWNQKFQKNNNYFIKTQSLSGVSWQTVLPTSDEIKDWYKKMVTKQESIYQKVLAMNFRTLYYNIENLDELFIFDARDTDFPKYLNNSIEDVQRNKRTSYIYNRDRRFRNKVLKAYNNQCAICRCKEELILEAAHIKAVADNGSDDVRNGICLCRNHHRMFDENLIKIDYDKLTLKHCSQRVKEMPWYDVFINKYNGKILESSIK